VQQQPLISVRDVMSRVAGFLPSLVAGIVVLAIGLLAWWLVAKFVARLLIVLRLDRVLSRLGWGKALSKGDVRHALFELLGTILGAIVFLIFLDNAFVIWNLTVLSRLLESLVLLIPDLVVAAVIVAVGWITGALAARSASRGLSRAGVSRAALAAQIIRTAILVLAVAIALVQLNVAATIVSSAFLITFGALGLSFVLAVGLGSRRAVELMWEEVLTRRRETGRPRPAPRTGRSPDA
jgi:Mechanosensitive ion channel, conserved TM helix